MKSFYRKEGGARKSIIKEKDCSRPGRYSLQGVGGSYHADDLIFLWGMETVCVADSFALIEKLLTDWLRLHFWGRLKLQLD